MGKEPRKAEPKKTPRPQVRTAKVAREPENEKQGLTGGHTSDEPSNGKRDYRQRARSRNGAKDCGTIQSYAQDPAMLSLPMVRPYLPRLYEAMEMRPLRRRSQDRLLREEGRINDRTMAIYARGITKLGLHLKSYP